MPRGIIPHFRGAFSGIIPAFQQPFPGLFRSITRQVIPNRVETRRAVSAKRQMQLFDLLHSILADTARRVPTGLRIKNGCAYFDAPLICSVRHRQSSALRLRSVSL